MSGAIHKLTARTVETIAETGRHADGGNLYLNVTKAGGKSWVFFYRFNGKMREMGLGSADKHRGISLAQARKKAAEARALMADGVDPLEARKAERAANAKAAKVAPTFGTLAKEYVATHEASWSNPKHIQQWRTTLEKDAAALSDKPVDQIAPQDVLAVLQPIWTTKPETARRLRGRIERVLDAAIAAKHRGHPNPALWKGNLEPLLPALKKSALVEHRRSLPYQDMPEFMEALRARSATAALALEFLILTASRTSEVTLAQWSEVDLDERLWRIPAQRMKMKKDHEVPLSDRAVMILETVASLASGEAGAFLFPSRNGKPLSNMAMLTLLDRMKYRSRTTVHGFRSSFRIWAAEQTSFPRAVAEAALAHSNPDRVEAAYMRSTLLPQRREMMAQWAEYVEKRDV